MFSDNLFREDSWQFPVSQIGFPLQCGMQSLESLKSPFSKLAVQNNFQFILFLGIPYISLTPTENIRARGDNFLICLIHPVLHCYGQLTTSFV